MQKIKAAVRLVTAQLNLVGILFYSMVYSYVWYNAYYKMVFPIDKSGFWQKGNWLMVGIYAFLFYILSRAFEGNKLGYHKALDLFLADTWAILCVNTLTFLQIALMAVWPVRTWGDKLMPIIYATAIDFAIAAIWSIVSQYIYHAVFPPKKMLLIYGNDFIDEMCEKIEKRRDRYDIKKTISIHEGVEEIKKEDLSEYDGVLLWDIPDKKRNRLLKHFYSQAIRVYLIPKISDVLVKGAEELHLVDMSLFMVREYALTFSQRFIKRMVDIVCSLILLVVTTPIMIISALIIKLYDGGPVLYKQIRCTKDAREFYILKFRSMKVDAESDGVARLASKADDRITPIGKFIRAVRIDELPQLINILIGDMSFIGPRPERPELIAQYMEEMPEFAFRMKVKAGLAGYAQVYGKYNTKPYDKLKLDLTYIENYTLYLDFKLMLLTLKILFQSESTEGVN